MTYDMKPLGYTDIVYKRTVRQQEIVDYFCDEETAIQTLEQDFYAGACTKGVLYDYDFGLAISVTPLKVDKDFTNITLDEYKSTNTSNLYAIGGRNE